MIITKRNFCALFKFFQKPSFTFNAGFHPHLRDGIEAGLDDFVMTNHDPVMADIIHLPEYLEFSD